MGHYRSEMYFSSEEVNDSECEIQKVIKFMKTNSYVPQISDRVRELENFYLWVNHLEYIDPKNYFANSAIKHLKSGNDLVVKRVRENEKGDFRYLVSFFDNDHDYTFNGYNARVWYPSFFFIKKN